MMKKDELLFFSENELKVLQMDIEDAELYQKELSSRNHIPIRLPLAPVLQSQRNVFEYTAFQTASLEVVFDFRFVFIQ